jgi:pimeloyl-ACP methyl ester carboxylesterase
MATGTAQANGMTLAYETFGEGDGAPIVLVSGLGTQMLGWHEDLCAELAERSGRTVVRFDNRDAGESTYVDAPVDLAACLAGDTSSAPYSLDDMGDDVAGLLDVLGFEAAHVVGVSMGGMIAQALAARHPRRVLSLTSIMSTTGERAASEPTEEAMAALLLPAATTREEAKDRAQKVARAIGSPAFERDQEELRERAARAWDRGHDPSCFARQLAAIQRAGDRTEALREVSAPTLVIHGQEDPLIRVGGGRATAAAIAGAELWEVPGMGHDLPRQLWPELTERIAAHAEGAERAAAAA